MASTERDLLALASELSERQGAQTVALFERLIDKLRAPPSPDQLAEQALGKMAELPYRDVWIYSNPGTDGRGITSGTGAHLLVRVQSRVPGVPDPIPPPGMRVKDRSNAYALGRITQIMDYVHPADAERYQSDDGDVPDGLQIKHANGEYTEPYLYWRHINYYVVDCNRLSGAPFSPSMESGPPEGRESAPLEAP
jgi:hypothetical protein